MDLGWSDIMPVLAIRSGKRVRMTLFMIDLPLWWLPMPLEWDITKTTMKMTNIRIANFDKLVIMYNKKG